MSESITPSTSTSSFNWFTYQLSPIDFNWGHLKSVKDTLSDLVDDPEYTISKGDINTFDIARFMSDWEDAKKKARQAGWEGDFRDDPVVFWLPNDDEFSYGFAFKQDNNGTTYVISPVAMPWLKTV